jgi:hypothetical protein
MNRRSTILSVLAAILVTLSLSGAAAAQGNDPWWGRNDRNRDDRRDRRDGYYGRYDERTLRDAASRIKDRAKDFERDVDRALDRSRVDGTRREGQINDTVHDFRRAADRFKSSVGNGRDLNRSADEARELVARANQIDRVIGRARLDSRAHSDWSSLNQDLRLVANIYGLSYGGGGYYGNDRDRYPNDRRDRRDNDDWWRRIPGVRIP